MPDVFDVLGHDHQAVKQILSEHNAQESSDSHR